ncbi:MAG: right-handed parallel beta-helix repeat-containing protein [Thermoanaerobaculia bacterium]
MRFGSLPPLRLAITMLLCAVPPAAFSANYYVAPQGSDANPGSDALPWRTIGQAASTMVAGDTVYIRDGTYAEAVSPKNSGAAGAFITYTAYPGHTPTIDGATVVLGEYTGLVYITGTRYIRISKLRVINAGPEANNAGILVDTSDSIVIEDNATYNTMSSGIGVWASSNVTVAGNDVRLCCNDGQQECITIAGTDGFEVRNNTVHESGPGTLGGEGIDVKDGSANGSVHDNDVHDMNRIGIYVDAWDKHTRNITIYRNRVHDINADGMAVASEAGGLLENVSIYNNIVHDNTFNGLIIGEWGVPSPTRPVKNLTVINNTFANNGRSGWGGGLTLDNPDAQGVVIRNNIFSGNETYQINTAFTVPGLVIDHNLIDAFRGYETETRGSEYQEGDPQFAGTGDFHLRATSIAIDTGAPLDAPSTDFDGWRRPQGRGTDIGAYEYPLLRKRPVRRGAP